MKKLLVLFACVAVLFGCKSSSKDVEIDIKALYGQWNLTEIEVEGTFININDPRLQGQFNNCYFTFSSDKVINISFRGAIGTGTYDVSGNKIIITDKDGSGALTVNDMSSTRLDMTYAQPGKDGNLRGIYVKK